MNMKNKSFLLPFMLIVLIGSLLAVLKFMKQGQEPQVVIGVLQAASHPALDAIYDGFEDELKHLFDVPPKLKWQNAQGAMSEAQTIAQSFHTNDEIKLILSIATSAAQAIVNKETEKPIILTAVTDSSVLDIGADQINVCGFEDRIDIAKMMKLISGILPNAKRAGIVYNPSEINSVLLAREMEEALNEKGISVQHVGVYHEQEITQAMTSASRKVDFFLAPTDNMVALSIDRISVLTEKLHKPFIASDILLASKGATAACGVDYKKAGRLAARVAHDLLIGLRQPAELGITKSRSFIVQHKQRSKDLNLPLIEGVDLIDEEKK